MQTKQKLFRTVAFAIVAASIVGCGGTSQQSDTSTAQDDATPKEDGVTNTEVIFGTHTDLTGPIALFGVESVNAAQMRFDEVNETGGVHGRNIRFVVEDSQYDVPRSVIAANKLLYQDKIFAMLLALGTPNNNAVLTQQLELGVPNLFPLTGSIQMSEPFNRLKFTQRAIYFDEMYAGAGYFLGGQGYKRPCVIYLDNDYGQENLDAIVKYTTENNIEIAATSAHKATETEFTASIIKFKNARCDIVFMGTVIRDTILILNAIRTLGWEDIVLVGSNAAAGQPIASMENKASEGYYAYAHMTPIYLETETRQENIDWYNKFKDRFGAAPDVPAMESYRGADIVVTVLENVGRNLTRDSFIDGLESLTEYTGPFGYKLTFGPNDHRGVDESTLIQAQNGRWVVQDIKVDLTQQ